MIGVGLFFPKAGGEVREYTYYSADLSDEIVEEEGLELGDIDAADEAAGEAQAEGEDGARGDVEAQGDGAGDAR